MVISNTWKEKQVMNDRINGYFERMEGKTSDERSNQWLFRTHGRKNR
ncbi:hypothetical protein BN1058_01876 [Paraliobacillus sp. PM-2]|nr:hypothetical protein BN1058_01876 [Paraliobacillus sp. PM-2]